MAAKYGFGLVVTAFEQMAITAVTGGLGFSGLLLLKKPIDVCFFFVCCFMACWMLYLTHVEMSQLLEMDIKMQAYARH